MIKKDGNINILTKNKFDALLGEFNSYLYDDSKQYISTIASNITDLFNILVTNNIII